MSLGRRFGRQTFRRDWLDVNGLFKVYFYLLKEHLATYGPYIVAMACTICKLCMHVRTIGFAGQVTLAAHTTDRASGSQLSP